MNRRYCILVVAAFLVGHDLSAQEVTIAGVEAAWKKREQSLRSFEVRWNQSVTWYPGSITETFGLTNANEQNLPPEKLTLPEQIQIAMDGTTYRQTYTRQSFDRAKLEFEALSGARIFDGSRSITYSHVPPNQFQSGVTVQGMDRLALRHIDSTPILVSVRPLADGHRFFDIQAFEVSGTQAVINGRQCWELRKLRAAPKEDYSIWVAPADGFTVRRIYQRFNSGVTAPRTLRTDVEYSVIDGITLPKKWTFVDEGKKGVVTKRVDGTVVHWSIAPVFAGQTFSVATPGGSVIEVLDSKSRSLEKVIVTRPNGDRSEHQQNRPELFSQAAGTSSAEDLSRDRRKSWRVAGVVSLIVVVTVIVVRACRRKRRHLVV